MQHELIDSISSSSISNLLKQFNRMVTYKTSTL